MRAKKSRNRGRLPTVFTTKSSFASSSTSMVHPPSVGPPFYPRRKEGGSIMATRSAKNGIMSRLPRRHHHTTARGENRETEEQSAAQEEHLMWCRTAGCIVTLTLGILAMVLAATAQLAGPIPRIGWLFPGARPAGPNPFLEAFREELRNLGY